MNILSNLHERGFVSVPEWLVPNTVYLTQMGSVAYGSATDFSDVDVYGVAIPRKIVLFPHLYGYIKGFGPEPPNFEVWQQHHIFDTDRKKEYDFSVYSIVKFMDLLADGNPNVVDSIFTPRDCVLFSTQVGERIRENRHAFLSKRMFPKFRGYSFSQLHKIANKKSASGKRYDRIQEMGYDVKAAAHVVRLVNEAEQLFTTGDLDLRRDREMLKDIRRGNWTEQQIREYFTEKEKVLAAAVEKSKLPEQPDYDFLRNLLLQCLEMHYGSLENAVAQPDKYRDALLAVNTLVQDALR